MTGKCKMTGNETRLPCSAAWCPLFGDCLVECEKAVKKPQTNADRIRAMSDEELVAFINKIIVNHHIKNADNCNHCPVKGAKPCDTEGIIDWLKQPAEVNNG